MCSLFPSDKQTMYLNFLNFYLSLYTGMGIFIHWYNNRQFQDSGVYDEPTGNQQVSSSLKP